MWARGASEPRPKRRCLGGTGRLRLFAKEILDDRLQRAHDLVAGHVALPELQREREALLARLIAEDVVARPALRRLRLSLLCDLARVLARGATAVVFLKALHERDHFLHVALTNHLQQQ